MAHRKVFQRPESKRTNFDIDRPSIFGSITQHDGKQIPFAFKPRVPANTQQLKFPPTNPVRSMREKIAETHGDKLFEGRKLFEAGTTKLFHQTIPEPNPRLTGEYLTRKGPINPNTSRPMFADEWMTAPANYTPAQKNQYFAILDLRRTKFTSDHVWVSNTWRIDYTNFAKEYEKSCGLVLLRYGLYQFKTVRAASSEAVRQWKEKNNVQDEEEEPLQPFRAVKPTAQTDADKSRAGKRKAQEDLQSKPSSDTTSQNKRQRPAEREPLAETTTPALNKGKRKVYISDEADEPTAATPAINKGKRKASVSDEGDEEEAIAPQPAKVQKTMSSTRAFFERVANTPAKDKGKEPEKLPADLPKHTPTVTASVLPSADIPSANITTPALKPAQQSLGRSVFNSSLKPTPASGSNIFGYLSDASSAKGSGNDNADADAEGSSDDEAAPQEAASQSDEPSVVASGGMSTPLPGLPFPSVKPTATTGASSASSESSTVAPGRSLSDRIQKGTDGKPLRATPEQIMSIPSQVARDPKADMMEKEAAAAPSFKTWNPNTPIKFAASTSADKPLFGSTAPSTALAPKAQDKPTFGATVPNATVAPAAQDKPSFGSMSTNASLAPKAQDKPLFGSMSTNAALAPKAQDKPLFGFSASNTATAPTDASSQKDGVAANGTAGDSTDKTAVPTTTKPAPFGSLKRASPSDSEEPPAKKKSYMFGSSTPAIGTSTGPFGAAFNQPSSTNAEPPKSPSKPATFSGFSSFSGFPTQKPTASVSLNMPTAASSQVNPTAATVTEPSAPSNPLFGATKPVDAQSANNDSQSTGSSFGVSAAAPTANAPQPASFSFGKSAQPTSNVFGQTTGTATNVFGNSAPAAAPMATSMFSQQSASATNPATSFGGFGQAAAPVASGTPGLFGQNGASSTPAFGGFGQNPAVPAAAPTFSFGASQPQNDTANTSKPSGFNFGGMDQVNNPFSAGYNDRPALFADPVKTQDAFQSSVQEKGLLGNTPAFNFSQQNGGSTNGSNTPFTFGGASSLATTPATGTPEPTATQEQGPEITEADGEEKQAQINLTDVAGPGEEDEEVVHEVRAKALRLTPSSEEASGSEADGKKSKSPWATMGVGPLRLLKHKTTGAARLLLRAEPRGHVALNKGVLPNFNYKPENGGKYVKITVASDDGKALETWMLQVKTTDTAQALADALEAHKATSKK